MEYALDMQGFFEPGNNFIVKELAIIALHDSSDPNVFMFKEPYPWQRLTNKYKQINLKLQKTRHGLIWESGCIAYTEIGNVLKEYLFNAKKVYVKSDLIKSWSERFHLPAYNIKSIDYSQKPIKVVNICLNHKSQQNIKCALHNVKMMKKVILENFEWEDMEWEEIV